MSVRELQASTDADEFAEWLAFQAIDPASEERADFRAAIIATVISNMFSGKNNARTSPLDFMPYVDRPQVSEEEQARNVESKILTWARMMQKQQAKRKALGG